MRHPALRPAVGTGLLLLIPLAMTVLDRHKPAGDGWHWSPLDFVVMGALMFGAGFAYEFLAARIGSQWRRVGLGVVILCAVLGIWVELAVGGISQVVGYLLGSWLA